MTEPGQFSAGPPLSEGTRVILDRVEVSVRTGLHAWERHVERPNRLWVTVEMFARRLPPGQFADYDRVRERILSWRDRDHVDLLETLLEELADFVFEDGNVQACRVSILKPDIFAEARAVGVEISRLRPGTG